MPHYKDSTTAFWIAVPQLPGEGRQGRGASTILVYQVSVWALPIFIFNFIVLLLNNQT
jgi:hypothetical protein